MSPTQPQPVLEGTPVSRPGQGFNTFAGSGVGVAVKGDWDATDAENMFYSVVCTSTESFMQALDIKASVSAQFGFGAVDAKTEFARRQEMASTSVLVVVYARAAPGKRVLAERELVKPVPLDDDDALDDFFSSYGDSFVSSITFGAEYMATFHLSAQSRSQQQRLKAAIKGSASGVTAELATTIQTQATNENLHVKVDQKLLGASLPLPSPTNWKAMIAFAAKLSGEKLEAGGTVVSYETEGYERLPKMKKIWDAMRKARDRFTGADGGDGIKTAAVQLGELSNRVTWLENVYDVYGYTLDTQLEERAKQVRADVKTLKACIYSIKEHPTKPFDRPPLPSLKFGVPALNVTPPATEMMRPEFGGEVFGYCPKGTPWEDVRLATIHSGGRLNEIQGWRDTIRQISATYGDVSVTHGTGGGGFSQILELGRGEFVADIGFSGSRIIGLVTLTQLGVRTTAGKELSWGQHKKGNVGVSITVRKEEGAAGMRVFVGFAGREHDNQICSIGPMYSTFSPATWKDVSPAAADGDV